MRRRRRGCSRRWLRLSGPQGGQVRGINLAELTYEMSPAVMEGGEVVREAVVINLGGFLSALISFLIVAFVMFLIIKAMNRAMDAMKKEEATPAPAGPPADIVLLTEIRDLLAKD